jgi:hypothetical protein
MPPNNFNHLPMSVPGPPPPPFAGGLPPHLQQQAFLQQQQQQPQQQPPPHPPQFRNPTTQGQVDLMQLLMSGQQRPIGVDDRNPGR